MDTQNRYWPIVVIVIAAMVMLTLAVLSISTKTPVTQTTSNPHERKNHLPVPGKTSSDTSGSADLARIINNAQTWAPAMQSWYGQSAPDITLTDIKGNQHNIASLRGKNVIIIFWATWCMPCHMEIPHLIQLRKDTPQSDLAMLAISSEDPQLVKSFAESRNINYTVITHNVLALPAPYRLIRAIPSSIFVDKNGKIKLITEGLISLPEIRQILTANAS